MFRRRFVLYPNKNLSQSRNYKIQSTQRQMYLLPQSVLATFHLLIQNRIILLKVCKLLFLKVSIIDEFDLFVVGFLGLPEITSANGWSLFTQNTIKKMQDIKDSIITGNLTNVEQVISSISIIDSSDKSKTRRITKYFKWIRLCRFFLTR